MLIISGDGNTEQVEENSGLLGVTGKENEQLSPTLRREYYCEIFDDGGTEITVYAGIRSNLSSWSGRTG